MWGRQLTINGLVREMNMKKMTMQLVGRPRPLRGIESERDWIWWIESDTRTCTRAERKKMRLGFIAFYESQRLTQFFKFRSIKVSVIVFTNSRENAIHILETDQSITYVGTTLDDKESSKGDEYEEDDCAIGRTASIPERDWEWERLNMMNREWHEETREQREKIRLWFFFVYLSFKILK